MKNNILQGLIIVMSSLMLLSFASNNRNYQTECVTIETDGYVTIKIWDTKKGAKYKPEQARKDAIHAILFSGISGGAGCSTQPPILNKTEEQDNFNVSLLNSFETILFLMYSGKELLSQSDIE